jgi:CPA2 family monovalent cation:H+ antiporter-2
VGEVVRPELEGGVEIVRRTLLDLDLPVRDVQQYSEIVRREGLGESASPSPARARILDHLITGARDLEVGWILVDEASPLVGHTLAESALRSRTGVLVVAIGRGTEILRNPGPDVPLLVGDHVAVIGTTSQVAEAEKILGEDEMT